jgi:hypothetical protein
MQAFDLEPFVRYIKERNLANERNIPFYVQWVQRFLTANLPDIATSSRDRIQAFENLLSKNQSIQDWQIRQALKAVELYVKVFIPSANMDPINPDDREKAISEADRIYDQMRELIRLRHYSYRTEQTYLDWVRRYMGYAS